MPPEKPTIGQAIDQIVAALSQLEKREQQTVITTVCGFLELSPSLTSTPPAPGAAPAPQVPPAPAVPPQFAAVPPGMSGVDIRTLKDQKQPSSAKQMACVVAYYLLDHAPEAERKQFITSDDLEKYFKQAGFKLPQRLDQLLVDAKGAGYFETALVVSTN